MWALLRAMAGCANGSHLTKPLDCQLAFEYTRSKAVSYKIPHSSPPLTAYILHSCPKHTTTIDNFQMNSRISISYKFHWSQTYYDHRQLSNGCLKCRTSQTLHQKYPVPSPKVPNISAISSPTPKAMSQMSHVPNAFNRQLFQKHVSMSQRSQLSGYQITSTRRSPPKYDIVR